MGLESVYRLSLIMNLVDNLTGPMSRVSAGAGESASKLQKLEGAFGGMMKSGAVMAGIGGQITAAALSPVKATFATQKALGELSSLGVKDLQAIEDASRSFSDTWAGTTKADFITAAYDIKSGIASLSDEGVAGYTNIAGITAKATKSSIGEMTNLFATGYGIYKDFYSDLSDMDFGEMFSAGISKSVQQFKTTGSGMAQAIQSLGGSAATAQVPLEEQLSILGMLQATMSGSEAGTKYKAFLRSAAKGGKELGLSFTDANNQLLSMPEILEQLRGKFGETMDAAEKMEIQKAFGDTESVALIDLLYNKTGDLQDNILTLYGSMGQGIGVATEMAEAINQTEPDQYQKLQQQIQNVKEEIGGSLLPIVNEYMAKGELLISKVSGWIQNHQELVRVIMLVVLAFGGFLTIAGTLIAVVGSIGLIFTRTAGLITGFIGIIRKLPGMFETIRLHGMYAGDAIRNGFSAIKNAGSMAVSGIKNVALSIANMAKTAAVNAVAALKNMAAGLVGMARQAITTAATALPSLITAVWSFTAALLANPITWIVIAIVALVAGIALLWNKCEWFRNGVMAIWSAIKSGVSAVGNAIKNVFGGISTVFGNVLGAAKDTISEKLGNMKQAYEEHGGGLKGIAAAAVEGVKGIYTAGFSFIDHLTGGKLSAIKDKFADKFDGIKQVVSNGMQAAKQHFEKRINEMQGAYEAHGGGLKGIAAATMTGINGQYHDAFNALDTLTRGKLSNIKSQFTEKMTGIKESVLTGMEGAKQYAQGKLSEMKTAYEQSGGGMRGAAAAAMTGVRSAYTDAFNFIDNLTGGKFSSIRDKVSQGIQNIKNVITNSLSWFRESGKKVLTTFADGIKSAVSGPVNAVKGGLQKIRNMLPFSDAKTGPLSTLTLSGQRTMSTYASGIQNASALPESAADSALDKIRTGIEGLGSFDQATGGTNAEGIPNPVGIDATYSEMRGGYQERGREKTEITTTEKSEKETGVHIGELKLNVDFKNLKEFPLLIKFLREVEDYVNANGLTDVAGED